MVLGFLFDKALQHVVLIKKEHPPFMCGKLNGLGGRVERDETPYEAMKREFYEESGLRIDSWKFFVTFWELNTTMPWEVVCFCTMSDALSHITSPTSEAVGVYAVEQLAVQNLMTHVDWLIPLALTNLQGHCTCVRGIPHAD